MKYLNGEGCVYNQSALGSNYMRNLRTMTGIRLWRLPGVCVTNNNKRECCATPAWYYCWNRGKYWGLGVIALVTIVAPESASWLRMLREEIGGEVEQCK